MKAQELGNEVYKNDKKAPEANCMRALRTCRGEKINRETCVSARKKLLVHDGSINSTKLSEIINKEINNSIKKINNSIKDTVQTIAKQYSMVPRMQEEKKPILPCLKDSEQKSQVYQSHKMEKYRNNLPNVCNNRQTTRHASRQYNYLSMCDNSYPYTKTRKNTILLPVKNKVKNERKNKKSPNNVNTDNRKMTGNVNIYICSETKDSNQENNKKKSKPRLSTDTITTSSNTTTEQLNSRSASISSCKLINSIQEKRKKLQAQQPSNSIYQKCSSDNIVCDNKTLCRTSAEESSEFSKEQINVNDDDVECKDTISSTRDGCCCKDMSFSSMDLGQDLSDSAVPCSDFSVCDSFRPLQSWDTIYPSKARTMLNASDASSSNAICTNVEQRVCDKSGIQSNVCENNSAYTVCHAIDGSRWLPKSIYTDCVTYDKVPKECTADDCKYRNRKLQDLILNRNNVWKRQMEYKLSQQSFESCQRENAGRQRSTCSCIAEEEEDCLNEGKFLESVCNNTRCLEKRSVCWTPSSKLVETVCEVPFNTIGECVEQTCEGMFEDPMECLKGKCNKNLKMLSVCQTFPSKLDENATICESVSFSVARDRFEKMQTCKSTFENSVKCPKDTTMYETTFGNSEELTEVTRVCKKFVTEESPKDITVCRRMFGEPKGPPEEVIAGEALPDAEEAPKETICRKISDSNFVNQSNDKRVFLNDAKDNANAKENANNSNLNKLQKKNNENAKKVTIQLDNNVAFNNLTGEKCANDTKQDEQNKETVSNNLSKITTASVEPVEDSFSKTSSKIIYSITLPQTQVSDHPNLVSNLNEKETSNAFVNKRKTTIHLAFNQHRNNALQANKDPNAQNSAANKIDQSIERKTQEELKEEEEEEEEENQDISKERRTAEEKRDSFLNRSVKRLTDMIKLGRMKMKERTEIAKDIPKKIIADDKIKDVEKSDIIEKDKITITPVRYRFKGREVMKKRVVTPKPTAPVPDFAVSEEIKEIIPSTHKTPKLLRVIAEKRSHLPPTVTTVDPKIQELKEEFIPVDVIEKEQVDQEEISEEKVVPQEPIPAEIARELKAEELIAEELKAEELIAEELKAEELIAEELKAEELIAEELKAEELIAEELEAEELIAEELKAEELIVPEVKVDIPKDVIDEYKILKDIDETSKIYVACPQKKLEEELQKFIPCKCVLPSEPKDPSCSIATCAPINVLCPQKKLEEELQKSIPCKCVLPSEPKDPSCSIATCAPINVLCPQKKPEEESSESISFKRFFDLNEYPCLIAKCAKYNNTLEDHLLKNNEFEQRKNYCAYCHLSKPQCTCVPTQYLIYKDSKFEQKKNYCAYCRLSKPQCTCVPTQYLKSCLKTEKPKFYSMSPSSSYCCKNCCGIKEECRKTTVHCHEKCKWCTMSNCSKIINKCRCRSLVNCINCYKSRDRCCCVTFVPVDSRIVETNCNYKKAMICLYCDNREDKCTCRAPIEKCLCCGLPSDVCDCQNDEDRNDNCERISREPDEDRSIRVTSWKPKREIRRYFARNLGDFQSDSIEECHCYEKSKRQRCEELPYQRLNIFSDVMNELQQKMIESVCCSRCWRNPCCCGSQIGQDKGKEKRKANVEYHETERLSKSKSLNNRWSSSKNEHNNIVKKSIVVRHIGCVCKLSPCRCRKNGLYKKPLAKCYYCKSLPCSCVITGSPVKEAVQMQ